MYVLGPYTSIDLNSNDVFVVLLLEQRQFVLRMCMRSIGTACGHRLNLHPGAKVTYAR